MNDVCRKCAIEKKFNQRLKEILKALEKLMKHDGEMRKLYTVDN